MVKTTTTELNTKLECNVRESAEFSNFFEDFEPENLTFPSEAPFQAPSTPAGQPRQRGRATAAESADPGQLSDPPRTLRSGGETEGGEPNREPRREKLEVHPRQSGASEPAEPHDPYETRQVLIPHLGGERKLDALVDQPPRFATGRQHRRMWFSHITPQRARTLVEQAREDAVTKGQHPWTMLTVSLDAEITGRARPRAATISVNPGSYELKQPAPERTYNPVLDGYREGGTLRGRSTGEDVQITQILTSGGKKPKSIYVLSSGERIDALQLHLRYEALRGETRPAQPPTPGVDAATVAATH